MLVSAREYESDMPREDIPRWNVHDRRGARSAISPAVRLKVDDLRIEPFMAILPD